MKKTSVTTKQQIKKLTTELQKLQTQLSAVYLAAGVDPYITVKIKKNQARFERVRTRGKDDVGVGHYFMQIDVTAKKDSVVIPLSIASGKKPTGFTYQIEGTAEGFISSAHVACQGEGITQVTLGTIVYAKIPSQTTASFRIQIEMKGSIGKVYQILIHRINYKLDVTDARYRPYLTDLHTQSLKFS